MGRSSDARAGDPDTLWFTRCPVPTGFGLSIVTGELDNEFAADRYTFVSLADSLDQRVRDSHFDHKQRRSFRHGGPIPPLVAASRGADVAVIGLSWLPGRSVLLGKPGERISSAEELAGKRVSLARRSGDSIDYWRATQIHGYETLLGSAGLGLGAVQLIDVEIRSGAFDTARVGGPKDSLWGAKTILGKQREEALRLLHGDVDYVFSRGAIASVTQGAFGLEVAFEETTSEQEPLYHRGVATLTVSREFVTEHPEVVARVLEAARRSAAEAADDRDRTRILLAQETGLPIDLVEETFGPRIHRDLDFDLAADKRAELQSLAESLGRHGFLDTAINVEDLIVDVQ